jgi:hypothetical protein
LTPRHIARTTESPHFASDYYKNSIEYKTEQKVELFFKKIRNKFLIGGKNGKNN